MDTQDYRVAPLTLEQIESRAVFFRKKWGISDSVKVDVYRMLFVDMPQDLKDSGLKLISRAPGYMGLREAYARSKPRRIFYRDRLFAQLRLEDPRASITFLHELAHIILHPGAPKAWMTNGNASCAYIEEERSAEWQATMFALCVKAPTRLSYDCSNSSELARKFGLCDEDAERRFEDLRLRRPRKVDLGDNKPKAIVQKDGVEATEFLCPVCGAQRLQPQGSKDFCDNCKSYGDKFQDGDTLGFDF